MSKALIEHQEEVVERVQDELLTTMLISNDRVFAEELEDPEFRHLFIRHFTRNVLGVFDNPYLSDKVRAELERAATRAIQGSNEILGNSPKESKHP